MQLFRKTDLETALELAGLFEGQKMNVQVLRHDDYYGWEWYSFPVRYDNGKNQAFVDHHGIRINRDSNMGTISFGHAGVGLRGIYSNGVERRIN